tara:strand:+ start:3634 stop:5178 length:1545 start_codon:yes stop_codon:yes gene_type:complete
MKKIILLFLLLFFVNLAGNTQCDNGTNYYPSSVYDPVDGLWGSATTCNWAGEVIQVNIISGDQYEFSTCDGYGGVLASYDTQLTLIDELGTAVGFNDDYSGCSGYTSYINWTANYTGTLYVHLNQYNCATNNTCTQVMILRTAGSGGGSLEYTEVGNSASTVNNGRVPTYGYYDYSWSAALYHTSDLGPAPIIIDKMSYDVTNVISSTMNNQSIFMAYTDELEFLTADSPEDGNGPWDGWTKVFEGDVTWEYGWNEIILDQFFYYDGNRGFIIKWVNNDGSWDPSYPSFRYTSKANTVVYNYNDGTAPPNTGFINFYRPNMRFNHGGSALPITLISFGAESNSNNGVTVDFSVASQVNNDKFLIEKSKDAYEWSLAGELPGEGNSNTQRDYTFIDKTPFEGISYYRLTQIDYDGKSETFYPVSVNITPNKVIGLNIIPNPAIDFINLELVYSEGEHPVNHNIKIFNSKGECVYKMFYLGELNDFSINVSKYPSGYYLVKSKSDNLEGEGKFIKK